MLFANFVGNTAKLQNSRDRLPPSLWADGVVALRWFIGLIKMIRLLGLTRSQEVWRSRLPTLTASFVIAVAVTHANAQIGPVTGRDITVGDFDRFPWSRNASRTKID